MDEQHLRAVVERTSNFYREKAAELRAAAERTSNFSVSVELAKVADNYDSLAELVDNQSATPRGG
jgi:endonuclease III-like uncharacterized protein